MSKNIFKQFILIILFVVVGASFLGCQKKEIVEDNKSIENAEKLEDESVESDLEVVEIVNEDQERKPYEFAGIEIDYPEGWYYIEQDIPGGGFISNKKHSDVDSESSFGPDLEDDEVRVYISSAPYDDYGSPNEGNITALLEEVSFYDKRDVEQECKSVKYSKFGHREFICKKIRTACYDSGIKEKNEIKYIIINCEYSEQDENTNKEKFILEREIAYEIKKPEVYIERVSMVMFSYNKNLLKESDLDRMFDDVENSLLND